MKTFSLSLFFLVSFVGCQTAPRTGISVLHNETTEQDKIKAVEALPQLSVPDEKSILTDSKGLLEQIGFVLYDPSSKKILSSQNADKPFIPASVSKVVTAVAALKILGPTYRFKTELSYRGQIKNHTLYGDLYLKGTGDPFLTAADLMSLVQALRARGIQQVKGHFFYDESRFITQESIDETRDSFASYNSGLSALSSEFNQLSIRWKPAQQEARVMQAYSIPSSPLIEIGLAEQDFGEDTQLSYQKAEKKDRWLLSPYASAGGKQNVPVKRPGYFTASFFQKFGEFNHISLPEPELGKIPKNAQVIFRLESLPLETLVQKVLEFSNNLMAELIHLTAAQKLTGKALSLKASAQTLQKWLVQKLPEEDWKQFKFENGSGLGTGNRFSPKQMLAVLKLANQEVSAQERPFLSLLPISGWKGTLSDRLASPNTAFRVWAKTGSQSYCNSLAGYIFTQSGKKLMFAFLATDYLGREEVDRVTGPLPAPLSRAASSWGSRVRALQDQLLASWIQTY